LGNQSAVKHGLRQTVSKLPEGCHYISQACYGLRRHLEAWCLERRGQVGLWESLCIQSALRYEQVSQLCARWLREADGELSHTERLGYAKQIADASDKRDRVLLRLWLDKQESASILDVLYGPQTPLSQPAADQVSEPVQGTSNAPAGQRGDEKGVSDAT